MSSPGPGSVIGSVRLVAPLGQGSMGVVWKARHLSLDIPVAAKVVRSQGLSDPRHRERLRREAQLAARLSHPGIVRVLDFVDDPENPCLVMELVEGSTLEAYLRGRGAVEERIALLMGFHLAGALAVAHEGGVLHRDIKLSNILIASDGTLKLSDLGLARPLEDSSLTENRNVLGTPCCMAPEIFTRASVPDVRSDLYALGVVLFQILSGAPPFTGTVAQVIHGHLNVPPDLGRIPVGCRRILELLLEKEPSARVASARELREMLRTRILEIDSERRASSSGGSSGSRHLGTSDTHLLERLERHLASSSVAEGRTVVHTTARERVIVGVLLAVVMVLGLAGWLLMRR